MQFNDLAAQYAVLKDEIEAGIADVISGGRYILGPQVAELEKRLAEDTGRPYCVTCANGTDALVLVLKLWGIGPGDAVFVPDFTYFASAACVTRVGATMIPVDIDPRTFNMNPDALEKMIQRVLEEGQATPKAIIPVDLFGQPADYPRIEAIAKKYQLRILEDAAQGYGGAIGARRACAFGDASATSFFPAKPLGCYGDGGAVFVDTPEEVAVLRSLRANGSSPADKYDNVRIGMNSRLDTLQAAILLPKLAILRRGELDARNAAAARYTALLKDCVQTPVVKEGFFSSWAQYSILFKDGEERAKVRAALTEAGIPSMLYYPRGIHAQTAYGDRHFADEDYPATNDTASRILSLPMHPYLTEENIGRIAEVICRAVG